MFVLVLLTFVVGGFTLFFRVKSVVNKQLSIKFFQTMQSEQVPQNVIKSTRCFNNLFEIPVLFYVVSSLYITQSIQNDLVLICAWGFVVSRVVQACIHLTNNNVIHRMLSFWLGCFFILAMWINLLFYFL
ncbi:MAPEG family protein [Marinicellulosiphila megalodicopiae]|uniref:MAPEG family protein n=1 Tax=Marinicellulosiphila megalodicopiae TaxID=2724896 RepID=UPI003BAFE403